MKCLNEILNVPFTVSYINYFLVSVMWMEAIG